MALAFLVATVQMGARLAAPKEAFQRARTFVALGVVLGFGLLFIGFLVIAGEWFLMWQSSRWNAQEPAFRMCMIILACGIYVLLDNDGDVHADRSERD